MNQPSLFQTFFLGGFECSCHQLRSGKRLDLVNATGHDRHVRADTEHLPYLLIDARQRAEYQVLLAFVDQIICVSEEAAKSYRKAGVPAQKITVVRNGILPKRVAVDRAALRTQLGLPPTAQLVLTVARMTEQKGHQYLLAAIRIAMPWLQLSAKPYTSRR